MTTWVALLRSVNVGGHNILPMKALANAAGNAGFTGFATYIQSGNCVFLAGDDDPQDLAGRLAQVIEDDFGFRPPTLVMRAGAFAAVVAANPFDVADADANTVHIHFAWQTVRAPKPAEVAAVAQADEAIRLIGNTLYLHAPAGIGRSKLAEKLPSMLGAEVTVRNLRTARKIVALAETVAAAG